MSHPYAEESVAASRAALQLPENHPGYVPASAEVWKAYAPCTGCGRRLALHMPTAAEVEEQGVVAAHANDAQAGPLCSYACLATHQPEHPVSQGLHPDSIARDLRRLQIEQKRREIAALMETL